MKITIVDLDYTYSLDNGKFSALKVGNYYEVVNELRTHYEVKVADRAVAVNVPKDRCVVVCDTYLQHFSKENPENTGEYVEVVKQERPESDHYHTGSIDVWKFADENFSLEEVTGFHRIDAIKYLTRYGKKKGFNRADLEKARVEIDKLLELHDEHRS